MSENTLNEIVRLWHGGSSRRRIARRLGISRHQVEKVLAAHQRGRSEGTAGAQLPRAKRRRARSLDKYEQLLEQLLKRYPDITAVRAHEELQKLGFGGSYNAVKRGLRELRPGPGLERVQRFETAPGEQAQMDYSTYTIAFTQEGPRRVHLFRYVLGYWRRQYLRFVESQDFATTVREHVRAFTHLGGVAATCLYDNMKVVVTRYDGDEPVYNTRFLAFATHYGYRPWACRPRRGQTKGKVERPFDYVEKNLLNGRTFRSLEHLNEVTQWWLEHVADVRIHRATKQSPRERHQAELPHLIPLPAQAYDTAEVVYRCVNGEGLIVYCQNYYSVPDRYLGLMLPVRITEAEVIIYGPHVEEIARHPRRPREVAGQISRLAEHEQKPDEAQQAETLQQRSAELGEWATRFLAGLLRHRRYAKDEAQKILRLLEMYSRQDLRAALERAARYGAYSRSAVERILAVTSMLEVLAALVSSELAQRRQQALQRRIQRAKLPPRKTLEDYDFDFPKRIPRQKILRLFDCEFVSQHGSAILIGRTGTGKTHLLNALAYTACEKGFSVRWTRAIDMIHVLTTAQINGTLEKNLREYTRPQLLLLDELGYLPIDKRGADLMFQVVAARYECGSIVLTTNRIFREWGKIFPGWAICDSTRRAAADGSLLPLPTGPIAATRSTS